MKPETTHLQSMAKGWRYIDEMKKERKEQQNGGKLLSDQEMS